MCGIFAYLGEQNVPETLFKGLRRLEYRGYDSAGIAMVHSNQTPIPTIKCAGKVSNLNLSLMPANKGLAVGISHTRWATHGVPGERNAHPHLSECSDFAIVHNGIIENYREIKTRLQSEGVIFRSETDTEVIVHLIARAYKGNLTAAVVNAMTKIEGAYGIAVITSHEPGVLVGARKGSPLVLGIGEKEMFLASDAAPIVAHTNEVIYFDDGEIVTITKDGYKITDIHAVDIEKEVVQITYSSGSIEKQGFDTFMEKEIFEQPDTLTNTLRGRILHDKATAKLDGLNLTESQIRNIRKIELVACGTSWHAALTGEYLLENIAGIPAEVDYASEFTHRNYIPQLDSIVLAISQSGETADTLAALREAKSKGTNVYGVVNGVGSTIARETNGGIYLHAGPEIGVASTKAFTSQVAALTLITLLFGRQRTISYSAGLELINELERIPEKIAEVLKQAAKVKEIVQKYFKGNNSLFLGRGYNYPVALEGALKLKEISYIHAEGYPAAEMKHGPIALIEEGLPVMFIATRSSTYQKVLSNIQEVKARKGNVIAVASQGDLEIAKFVDEVIYVPETMDALSPLLNVVPLQLLALYAAVERGCDVDQPRNLAKSVTVE